MSRPAGRADRRDRRREDDPLDPGPRAGGEHRRGRRRRSPPAGARRPRRGGRRRRPYGTRARRRRAPGRSTPRRARRPATISAPVPSIRAAAARRARECPHLSVAAAQLADELGAEVARGSRDQGAHRGRAYRAERPCPSGTLVRRADVAQLAEHRSRKAGVEGSSPSVGFGGALFRFGSAARSPTSLLCAPARPRRPARRASSRSSDARRQRHHANCAGYGQRRSPRGGCRCPGWRGNEDECPAKRRCPCRDDGVVVAGPAGGWLPVPRVELGRHGFPWFEAWVG